MNPTQGKSVSWGKTLKIFIIVFGLSLGYVYLRYVVVRSASLDHLPLYLSNKAFALTSAVLIGLSFILGPLARFWPKTYVPHLYLRKHLGVVGFGVAAIHALISLLIFTPAYYGRFFDGDTQKLTFMAESSMLFGILAFLIFTGISITSLPPMQKHMHPEQWLFLQRMGYLAYVFVLFHVALMGWGGWFRPDNYAYGLATITLVSALFIILVLVMRVLVMLFPGKKSKK